MTRCLPGARGAGETALSSRSEQLPAWVAGAQPLLPGASAVGRDVSRRPYT